MAFMVEPSRDRAGSCERGTVLIELLTAIVLLTIVASGVFSFYSVGMFAGQNSEDLAFAEGLAQAQMEKLEANPRMQISRGEVPGPELAQITYQWTAQIMPVAIDLNQAIVTVAWVHAGAPNQTTLTSLLLAPGVP
jgi:Tfp pilus assembly protein PilV